MTEIELTEEQRRVLAAQRGQPLAVVDPDTQQRYVLVVREQYERNRSLLEVPPAQASGPDSTPAVVTSKPQPLRQRVRELPLTMREMTPTFRCPCHSLTCAAGARSCHRY